MLYLVRVGVRAWGRGSASARGWGVGLLKGVGHYFKFRVVD